jgi:hypothetical protein
MPSQLFTNDKISFVAAKPFTYRAKHYEIGDDFPQEEANNIETLVRSRYIIPVVEELTDKPRHWHRHIRPRAEVLERLNRDRVQLRMPSEPDSDEVVNIPQLTRPETTPEPEELREQKEPPADQEFPPEAPAEAVQADQYDPSYHTVLEVNEHLAAEHDEEERERILQAERDGRGRKGILEA